MIANAYVTQIGSAGSTDTWGGDPVAVSPRWQGRHPAYYTETVSRRRSTEGADVGAVSRTLTIFGGISVTPNVDDIITFKRDAAPDVTGRVLAVAGPNGHRLVPERMRTITVTIEDAE